MSYTIKEFQQDFPDDEACLALLFRVTNPAGLCPTCQADRMYRVSGRKTWTCGYGHHYSPLARTIFRKSDTPLVDWFYIMFLFSTTKTGVSAKEIERTLGVTYKTAWRMGHAIRSIMRYDVPGDDTPFLSRQFNRSIEATHNQISSKYFQSYIQEFVYRYEYRKEDLGRKMFTETIEMSNGHIYVLKNESVNWFKVGRSTKPRRRIENIQTSNPFHIETVGVFPVQDDVELELFLHYQLRRYKVRLEWFDLPAQVLTELLSELSKVKIDCHCEYCQTGQVHRESLTEAMKLFKVSQRLAPAPITDLDLEEFQAEQRWIRNQKR